MESGSSLTARLTPPLVFAVFVWGLILMLTWSPAAGIGQDALQGPPSDPPTLRIPQADADSERSTTVDEATEGPAPDTAGSRTREQIREALEGQTAPAETGDPILDGVMDVIRSQGSVLEGSALDADDDQLPRRLPQQPGSLPPSLEAPRGAPWNPGGPRPLPDNSREASAPLPASGNADRFLLAEQLLRMARQLAAQPYQDPVRRQLISDLRSEAARCLGDAQRTTPPSYDTVPADHTESY